MHYDAEIALVWTTEGKSWIVEPNHKNFSQIKNLNVFTIMNDFVKCFNFLEYRSNKRWDKNVRKHKIYMYQMSAEKKSFSESKFRVC